MDTFSFSRSSSSFDADVSMLMDTSQDFESSPGDVVKWVASQSTNPALQALMKEAERDKRTRASTPVDKPMSRTYPLSSATSSTSLTTSVSSVCHSSGHNLVDSLPLSSSSSSTSSSLAPHASEPSVSRRAKPLSAVQRMPLASSTSSANHSLRDLSLPRSSSHSNPFTSKEKYAPRDDEPEALFFIELLKDASKQVDSNSDVKERRVVRAKEKKKKRVHSPGRSDIDIKSSLDTSNLSARPLTKTTSASAVYPVRASTKALGRALSTSVAAHKPDPRGRIVARAESSGRHDAELVSVKSTPTSLPNPSLDSDPSRIPARISSVSNVNRSAAAAARAELPKSTSNDGDSKMLDVIDLTETDTELEKPVSGQISRADTTVYMELDDGISLGTGRDMSLFRPDSPPQTLAPLKPKLQTLQSTRHSAPTQHSRTGPPPLGMRRAPLQPSQYSSTQVPKGLTVPRFKPPLLANGGETTNKNWSGTKIPATMAGSKPPRVAVQTTTRDPDSSFDVSFDMDADALEEAMKAYD